MKRYIALVVLLVSFVLLLAACGRDKSSPVVDPLANDKFNLDFLTVYTGLTDTYGAASGQTGHWVNVPVGTTSGLVNTLNSATSVTLSLTGSPDSYAGGSTPDGSLLRDDVVFVFGEDIAVSATLTGLTDGTYKVYYYSYWGTAGLTINGNAVTNLAGGSADTLGAQGTNWDVADGVAVTGGSLTITCANVNLKGLSGIQIMRVR